MTYKYDPTPIYANTSMTDEELGRAVRMMTRGAKRGEWINVTMGSCQITGEDAQDIPEMAHLGTISIGRPDE